VWQNVSSMVPLCNPPHINCCFLGLWCCFCWKQCQKKCHGGSILSMIVFGFINHRQPCPSLCNTLEKCLKTVYIIRIGRNVICQYLDKMYNRTMFDRSHHFILEIPNAWRQLYKFLFVKLIQHHHIITMFFQ